MTISLTSRIDKSLKIFSLLRNKFTLKENHRVRHLNIKHHLRTPTFIHTRSMSQVSSTEVLAPDSVECHARQIFLDAVKSVLPREMIKEKFKYVKGSNSLYVEFKEYKLNRNVYVVGFGKAVGGMARVVDDMLRDHIVKGIISIPCGATEQMKRQNKRYVSEVYIIGKNRVL